MYSYFDTPEEIVAIHKKTIAYSGGGIEGVIDINSLISVINFIKDDLYYPKFEDKLTHLFWSINRNHSFIDGNKRLAISVCTMFIIKNGFLAISKIFLERMESISYHVAAGNIDKDLLHRIITSILYEPDYSESLKLEIANALSKGLSLP